MRLIKAVVAAVIGILGLVGLVLWLMPAERIANLAATQFEAATGRTLIFGGEVRPRFYPVIGATARNVRVGNPEWAGPEPLLVAEEMDIGLSLSALMRGDIDVQRIILQGPELSLRRDAAGRANWDFSRAESVDLAPGAPAAAAPARARAFSLAQAEITGGTIRLRDDQAELDLQIDALDATLRLPALDGPGELNATGALNGQDFTLALRTEETARFLDGAVTSLRLEAQAAGARLAFSGRGSLDGLVFEGRVDAAIPALRPLMTMAGQTPSEIDPAYLPLGVTGQVTRTADGRLFARDAQFQAGAIRLAGGADFMPGGQRPTVTAQLVGDVLDLRSGAAGSAGGSAPAAPAAPAPPGWSRSPIDASALGLMDADIAITLNGLRTDLTTFGRTRLALTIDRARAVVDFREVEMFGGQLGGEFVMNNRSGLSVGGNLRFRNVALLSALSELADFERLQGRGNLDLQFLGVGNTMHAIMTSLRGEGQMSFTQGEIIGFDLAGMLRNRDLGYVGEDNRTVFDNLTGSFTIADGVLRNDDLRLEAPRISATGRGTVGIGARNLDYRIVPVALVGEDTLRVPLMITGPWDEPRFRLDLEALAREQFRLEQERLEEIAREEARRLEERARSELEERLQRELGVRREEGERVQDTIRRGVEQEIGNRLQRLLGGN